MKFLRQKVYLYFWSIALLLIAFSIYSYTIEDAVLDINVHDTYFIIHYSHILQLLAIIYAVLGFIYWLLNQLKVTLLKFLTLIHSIISILIIPIYILGYYLIDFFFKPKFPLFDDTSNHHVFTTIIVFIGLISQLFFILNLVTSLFKHFFYKKQ